MAEHTAQKATGRGKASTGPKQAPLTPSSVPPGVFDEQEPSAAAVTRTAEDIAKERLRVAPVLDDPANAVLKTGFGPEDEAADLESIKQDDGDVLVTLKEPVYEEIPVPNSDRTTHVLKYAKGQQVPRKVLDAHKGRATEDKRGSATESK